MNNKTNCITITIEAPKKEYFFDLFIEDKDLKSVEKKLVDTVRRVAKDKRVVDVVAESL